MGKRILLLSDLHLSSRPQDEYFFELFPLVDKWIEPHKIDEIYILGDLTTAKDGHNAKLVNQIVEGILSWTNKVERVRVVCGNHDMVDNSNRPFFEFLGKYPKVEFITKPTVKGRQVFLPHSRQPFVEWSHINLDNKLVFAHVTVDGAAYESGVKAEDTGLAAAYFGNVRLAFSGDIHSRQRVGCLNYVGAPYQIKFGDKFQGGAVLLSTGNIDDCTWTYLNFDFPQRAVIDIVNTEDLKLKIEGYHCQDQFKVRLHLNQYNMGTWRQIRDEVKQILDDKYMVLSAFEMVNKTGVQSSAKQIVRSNTIDFDHYCSSQKITDELRVVAEEIMKEVSV